MGKEHLTGATPAEAKAKRTIEEEYLGIIMKENEIIEEGKLINSLLAGSALLAAAFLPPKVSAQTAKVATAAAGAPTGRRAIGFSFTQTAEEEHISKFIYAQVRGLAGDARALEEEITGIARTLATRFVTCREASTPYEMVRKISDVDVSGVKFAVTDRVTYCIARCVRALTESPEKMAWGDRTVVWYAKRSWRPEGPNRRRFRMKFFTANYNFWSVEGVGQRQGAGAGAGGAQLTLTKDEALLARVIYAETSTICTPLEVKLVCKVIMNRIGKSDFANGGRTPQNAADVVRVKNAFSCIGDRGNSNWWQFTPTLNYAAKRACVYAHYMMKGDQATIQLPSEYGDIVYYHDKSIQCPKAWTNRYWKPVLVTETPHFKFYKVEPNT